MMEKKPNQKRWTPEQQAAADETLRQADLIGRANVQARLNDIRTEIGRTEPGTEEYEVLQQRLREISSWPSFENEITQDDK